MKTYSSIPSSIIDIHCHVAAESIFPRAFLDGIVDNLVAALESNGVPARKETIAALYSAKLCDPLCDQLVKEMDDAEIAEAVLLLPDFTFALRGGSLTIAEAIDHHKTVLERHRGRFRVFAGVDPRWGSDGLALFEKAIREFGFHGLKLYPPCGYTPADPMLYPYYEICQELSLPVLAHIGASSPALSFEEARPIYVDQPAKDFPGVDFILAHGSVHYPDECAMLCRNRPNIFLDVSGFESSRSAELTAIFERGVNHKLLFGTDWPIFRLQGKQKDFVRRFDDSVFPTAMPERAKKAFFFGNAARLLAKGRSSIAHADDVSATATGKRAGA